MPTEHRQVTPVATLKMPKNPQKKQTQFLSISVKKAAKRGVLERVEDDDTRDHQKAANLVCAK